MFSEVDMKTIVDNGIQGLRTSDQQREREELQAENTRQAVGVDDLKPHAPDDENDEGEIKGMHQPKIAGLQGIEFDTGNS